MSREEENKRTGSSDSHDRDPMPSQEYALRIMEALSGVDEELLEKSGRSVSGNRAGRSVWRTAGTWAAVLCLMAAGAAGWQGYRMMQRAESDSTGGEGMSQNYYESMELAREDTEEDGPEEAPDDNAAAPYSGGTAGEKEGDQAPRATSLPEEGRGPEAPSAESDTDDLPGNENAIKDGADEGMKEDRILEEKKEGAEEEPSECPLKRNAGTYTEEEARKLEGLGEYIPDKLPEGYVFSAAGSDPDLGRENLTVCWERETDQILLYLEKTEENMVTVDMQKPETYDVRLYELPFEDTVPEEYRDGFGDPVFALADFELEAVKSRMYLSGDGGREDTPEGNFRVLYPGNIVISFRGRGTAEEIWEMFCSMKK